MKAAVVLIAALSVASVSAQGPLTTTNIQRYYTPVRLFLQGAADVMPADNYGFKLAPEQMDFGQWINHSTERNYLDCADAARRAQPDAEGEDRSLEGEGRDCRPARASFDVCDATFAALDDQMIWPRRR